MIRTIQFRLNNVNPTPASLRENRANNQPSTEIAVNLAQLFLHYYFDSFPTGPPNPDPSSFEYLSLVSPTSDFRFHAFVADASTVKKRSMSTEIGQAFCRWMLQEHFGIAYFAHLGQVIGTPTHAAFNGMRVERIAKGDIPDYLCARQVTRPYFAEAKGRFSAIDFLRTEFDDWRQQFDRVRVLARTGAPRSTKGYIVATRFATDANRPSLRTTAYVEDPNTRGEVLPENEAAQLGRTARWRSTMDKC